MKALLRRADASFFAPAPPERLALCRVLIGLFGLVYLVVRLPAWVRLAEVPARDFSPVGPLAFLSSPLPSTVIYATVVLAIVTGVAFVRGAAFRVTGPIYALSLLALTSYRSSFGMIFHTDNLLVLHTLVLAVVPASAAALAPGRALRGAPQAAFGWPLHALGLVTVLAYLLAGIAKLEGLGLSWAEGDVLMGHVAYDALRKLSVGGGVSPFGIWLLGRPAVFGPLATVSLLVELLAPLALLHRRIGHVWCASAWCFHLGVAAMMLIGFPYPLTGIAFVSFFPAERLLRYSAVARLVGFLTGASEQGGSLDRPSASGGPVGLGSRAASPPAV